MADDAARPLAPATVEQRRPKVDSLVGRQIGHFRVDALLGRGGMGAVYRAWDLSLDRPVALKTVLFDSPHTRALFFREARAQAKLRHAHVVPIHFVGDHEGLSYLVMELVEGDSLATIVSRDTRLNESRALDVVDAVASALEAAHAQGLIHRDVKPSNVLVETTGRVLLADFGLAKSVTTAPESPAGLDHEANAPVMHSGVVTQTGAVIGTPAYLAPEQTSGKGLVDHRADIYALGVTLYELVTGKPPFSGPTNTRVATAHEKAPVLSPRLIVPELRPALETLILRMLAKSPDDRFATYADLRRAIADARARPLLPAPFVTRLGAFFVDILPILIASAFVKVSPTAVSVGAGVIIWCVAAILFGLSEAYWGTTPGKRLMGLRTIDPYGSKPSLPQALLRSTIKLWGPILNATVSGAFSGVTFSVHTSTSGTSTKQARAAEDATSMLVVLVWILSFMIALGRRKLTLHDRATRTQVTTDLRNTQA